MVIINQLLEMLCKIAFLIICYKLYNIKQSHIGTTALQQHQIPNIPKSDTLKPQKQQCVEELAPEMIAPYLSNPPRPSGGFGRSL
jgi:hypothetical protein